jgi:hypothetical protein
MSLKRNKNKQTIVDTHSYIIIIIHSTQNKTKHIITTTTTTYKFTSHTG